MLSKINPIGIIVAHYASFKDYQNDVLLKTEIVLHIIFPAALALVHFFLVKEITEGVVSIVVSAASIVAGLMLNLLVLIYTLVYNAKTSSNPISNIDDFKTISKESLSTIAYSILLCLLLVLVSFLNLSRFSWVADIGKFITVYLGVAVVFCLLIVLKRCYAIVIFELEQPK